MSETLNDIYVIGDYINYRNNGICVIEDITEMDLGLGKKKYYILRSVYEENTRIKVPVDSKAVKSNMRRILSKPEIDSIIEETENSGYQWIDDYKKRASAFEAILNTGNRADILWVIKSLSLYKASAKDQKRKFGVTDEKILDKASKMVLQEFSFILQIKQEEVIPYIMSRVENLNKQDE